MARSLLACLCLAAEMGLHAGVSAEYVSGAAAPKLRYMRQSKPATVALDQRQQPEDPADAALDEATTPAPPRAAVDGYPQLPAVAAILGSATETMKSINSQANVLEARIAQGQTENQAKMARQKAIFEEKLKVQEDRNKELERQNTRITNDISTLKANNTNLRKHAKELQDGNKLMRAELRVLQSKLHVALDFLGASLKSSDDSQASELDVLQPAKAKATPRSSHHRSAYVEVKKADTKKDEAKKGQDDDGEDDEDDDADEDDKDSDDSATSFLSVAERAQRVAIAKALEGAEVDPPAVDPEANPQDLLAVLSKGVADLQKQENESEAKLKAMFLESFQAGTRRHATLVAQQKALASTRANLLALQSKLRVADNHLEGTGADLRQRLRGFGLFVQHLSHLSLAPSAEVQQLLKALPEEVSVAAAPAAKE